MTLVLEDRLCTRCRVRKPIESFSRGQWLCRPCNTDYMREHRAKDPHYATRANLRTKYRLTLEQYDVMLAAQDGHCAVCPALPGKQRLHVDHDHRCCPGKKTCGKCIRGLLCYPCNGKLGLLESDTEYAVRLRAYAGVTVRYGE